MGTTTGFDPEDIKGQTLSTANGTYEILELVDRGGFAYVYKAKTNTKPPRNVAIKVFKQGYPYSKDHELDLHLKVANLSERIVSIEDYIPLEGNAFGMSAEVFVLEWIEGQNLNALDHPLNSSPFLERIHNKLRVAFDVCTALATLHDAGYAHRDLSLKNIIAYSLSDTDGWHAKLLDLGLSSAYDEALFPQHGTARFRAPERIRFLRGQSATEPDGRLEDLYALGAILYYLFSGHFYLRTVEAENVNLGTNYIYDAILTETSPDLSLDVDGISDDLITLVNSLLAKDPQQRPQSAVWVLDRLETILVDSKHSLEPSNSPSIQITDIPNPHNLSEWQVAIQCYIQNGNSLDRTDQTIGKLSRHNPSVESPLFSKMHDEMVHVLLYEKQTHASLFEGRIHVSEPYFRISAWLDEDQNMRVGHTGSMSSPEFAKLPLTKFPPRIQLLNQLMTMDLCYVIDATMSQPDIELARSFAFTIGEALYSNGYPIQAASITYGEYRDYPLPNRHHALEVDRREFDIFPELYGRLGNLTSSMSFNDQDCCDALELGLREAVHLQWTSQAHRGRLLVMVGNSPPHPTPEERQYFKLLDYTCDEFEQQIDWHQEGLALREAGVQTTAYFVGTPLSLEYGDFVKHVWKELDSHQEFRELTSVNAQMQAGILVDRLKLEWPSTTVPQQIPLLPVLLGKRI